MHPSQTGNFSHFAEFLTYLSDHTLRDLPRVERVVETEASDVGVRADALNPRHVLDLLDLGLDSTG